MPSSFFLTNRFTTGWVSPSLGARTDWTGWKNALLQAENVILPPQGGAKRRPCLDPVTEGERASGVERIFSFDKNDRERYIIGLSNAGDTNDPTKYNASILTAAGTRSALAVVEGNLFFTDITRVRAFHYADSILFTQNDGAVPIQRIFTSTPSSARSRSVIDRLYQEKCLAFLLEGEMTMTLTIGGVVFSRTFTPSHSNEGSRSLGLNGGPLSGRFYSVFWRDTTSPTCYAFTLNAHGTDSFFFLPE